MSDVTAQKKFACPACGAEANWDPGRQALICPFCGTNSPAQLELNASGDQVIREHDLGSTLRNLGEDRRGWQAKKTSVKCQSCQAISVFDAERIGQRCDFCGSTALVPYEEIKEAIRPESLLPMKLNEAQVRDSIRQWYRTRWFAPNRLRNKALTDTTHGLYIPYWTFDAQVHADWTAESGYYYYTTETYRDAQGRMKTRQVRHIRWQPSAGSVDHFFDDELVAASKGVDPALLKRVEPFPTKELTAYNPGFLAGWVVERYQIDLVGAAQHARESMTSQIHQMCAARVPGDTHRNLRVQADFSGQTFKHILAPVWLLAYDYGRRRFQVVINGYTGAIAGRYPKSWIKITLALLALSALVGIVVVLANR
ncbi:MAG TPA: zinc ribbon domain-containing protein [Candidatus Paceibacterota bacterium]|nr:zinc ribbon domain-containing protein [Candidatus Paceibacterota bacterium]